MNGGKPLVTERGNPLAERLDSPRHPGVDKEFLATFNTLGDPLTASINYVEVARRLLANGARRQDIADILDKASMQAGRAGAIVRRLRALLEDETATTKAQPFPAIGR
jgi:phosphoglycerate-specific signal transduction histidine kinase